MVYGKDKLHYLKELEDNWEVVLEEYEKVKHKFIPNPRTESYTGSWDIVPFIFGGETDEQVCKLCPKTWEMVSRIPWYLGKVFFSILRPHSTIVPHCASGPKRDKFDKCHMGLKIPSDCEITIDQEPYVWDEGKCLLFDNGSMHSVINDSDEDRVLLILDMEKWKGAIYEAFFEAKQAYKELRKKWNHLDSAIKEDSKQWLGKLNSTDDEFDYASGRLHANMETQKIMKQMEQQTLNPYTKDSIHTL